MANGETPLQKRIRERADELKTTLAARLTDIKNIRAGVDAFKAAGIDDAFIDRMTTAMEQAVTVVLKAAETPPVIAPKK